MSRELKNATNQSFNNAFRLIRTETAAVDSQVTFEGYKQAQKELGLKYFKYDAHLDSRTSEICRELNGKIFKIDDYEIGVNVPPMHPNCRSCTQLILDEEEEKEPTKELVEYSDFSKFNRKAYGLARFVDESKDPIKHARELYDKNTLNSFYNVGSLTKEQKELLGTKTNEIKFSIDSMIKNRIKHKDLDFYDYQKIKNIINNSDKTIKDGENHIKMFKKIDNKLYEAVIKSTKDKKENYLVSLHISNQKRLKK